MPGLREPPARQPIRPHLTRPKNNIITHRRNSDQCGRQIARAAIQSDDIAQNQLTRTAEVGEAVEAGFLGDDARERAEDARFDPHDLGEDRRSIDWAHGTVSVDIGGGGDDGCV